MAILTYADLKTAIANFSDRSDLTDRIPEFITLAETRIFFGSEEPPFQSDPLRIRAMEVDAAATFDAQSVSLPTAYLQMRRLFVTGDNGGRLTMISPDTFWDRYERTNSGIPREFTLEGGSLLLGPTPDAAYTGRMLYYSRPAVLDTDDDTNWILENAPGAYLWGALIELAAYIFDADKMAGAHAKFVGIINALNKADKADRWSGSPWVGQTDTGNP